MKLELSEQEIEDLKSCLWIAHKNSPPDSPQFRRAILRLYKQSWKLKRKKLIGITFEYEK